MEVMFNMWIKDFGILSQLNPMIPYQVSQPGQLFLREWAPI
jgi:hypothetical protein